MEKRPDIAQVLISSDLDVTTVKRTRACLDGLIDSGVRRIVLNMAACSFMDSAGMALLFREIRRMRELGGLLSLINVSDIVMRSLRLARMVDFAPISAGNINKNVPALDPHQLPLWQTSITINPHELSATRKEVEARLKTLSFSSDEMFDLMLAIGEAMGNAVDHTACESCSRVTITAYPDRAVVDVTDNGEGFDGHPTTQKEGNLELERGRGIRLMKLLADSVDIEKRDSGQGTIVKIVKMIGDKS